LKKLLPLLLILFSFSSTQAQELKGKVVDVFARPISNVHIKNLRTSEHTHTDKQGAFLLTNVLQNDSLLFSHVGYDLRYFVVNNPQLALIVEMDRATISIDAVEIQPDINALRLITDIDLKSNSINSSQDILRQVPGLFIGQHAGGGKAEQIFLRGFDIDHGTDINITVDGMPVNMVSHAHGQGYADLHFLIPEIVERIDFGKGPYYAEQGNFNTAGYVDFQTKKALDQSSIQLEVGQFNTQRFLGLFNIVNDTRHKAYIATEFLGTDGPFESSQFFRRRNLTASYTFQPSDYDSFTLNVSHFESSWDASGQIPQRAVDQGLISRFGAIDDTEGGSTGRNNLQLQHKHFVSENEFITSQVFVSQYDFELYSNFTFFLEDSANGDQIKQKENRVLYGIQSEYQRNFSQNKIKGNWNLGFSFRGDESKDNYLANTINRREIQDYIQRGNVRENNLGAFTSLNLNVGKFVFVPALRYDRFEFEYQDELLTNYQRDQQSEDIWSPKLNILFNPSRQMQWYLKGGKGFHSNDTRVVLFDEARDILPAAYGGDFGVIWKPRPKMVLNAAVWTLYLDQEFVYVGDAGIVEPSGRTERQGAEFSMRYELFDHLLISADANYTFARSAADPEGDNFIPLAPDLTAVGSLKWIDPKGWFIGMNVRYMDDRPANENNSIIAEGYTVVDLNAGYQWNKLAFGLQIQNLFDTEWNETQFATESRLQEELESVEEIHFTPGTPFFAKGSIAYRF
jgi:outer membrane receptor protein involved in Fe transport